MSSQIFWPGRLRYCWRSCRERGGEGRPVPETPSLWRSSRCRWPHRWRANLSQSQRSQLPTLSMKWKWWFHHHDTRQKHPSFEILFWNTTSFLSRYPWARYETPEYSHWTLQLATHSGVHVGPMRAPTASPWPQRKKLTASYRFFHELNLPRGLWPHLETAPPEMLKRQRLFGRSTVSEKKMKR